MNLKAIGREAGRLVLELAGGKAVEPGVRKLPCQLIIRNSCGGNAAVTERRGGVLATAD